MSGGIQTAVNTRQAPGIEGAWASTNPRSSYVAGPGGLVAGSAGVTVGRFAWVSAQVEDLDSAPAIANNFFNGVKVGASNAPDLFIDFNEQALITAYLAGSSMVVPAGFGVAGMTDGDYWVKNNGSGYAQYGMNAYADLATGKITFASGTAAATTGTVATSAVAAVSHTLTGSVTGNIMTVTAAPSGVVYPGATLSGSGVSSGNMITSQLLPLLAGEAVAGIGRYAVSIGEQAAASTTITYTYGLLTLGATPTVTFGVGGLLSGSGVNAGTYVSAVASGSGAASGDTLVVTDNTVVSSTTITTTTNVSTKWVALSAGAAGELIKIGVVRKS